MTNVRVVIARVLLTISLLLITVNIASYVNIYTNSNEVFKTFSSSKCSTMYNDINRTVTYTYGGKSISDGTVSEWYWMRGYGDQEIYVRVSILRGLRDKNVIILIHDYGDEYTSLAGLAIKLVEQRYVAVSIDLPIDGLNKTPLLSSNGKNSWLYRSVCNVMKTISLIEKEYRVKSIGLVGVGFGGIVAMLTSIYDERVDYVASLGGLGGYAYGVEKASLLNYYIEDLNEINECLDPLCLLKDIDKDTLIILGSNDEYFPLNPEIVSQLSSNSKIILSIMPNYGHFRIPVYWEELLFRFIEEKVGRRNASSYPEISIDTNGLELIVRSRNYSDVLVLSRPAIPGLPWSKNYMISDKARYTYLLIPGEYIVVDRDFYRIYGIYYTRESYGLIIGLILVLIWLFIDKPALLHMRSMNLFETLYAVLLFSLIFYPLYPSIWCPDRFHLSLLDIAETYSVFLPILSYPIVYSLIVQPLVLIYMFLRRSRRAYTLYIILPLFIIIFTTTLLLFLGTRFYTSIIVIPTIPLFLLITTIVIDYIFTEKHEI